MSARAVVWLCVLILHGSSGVFVDKEDASAVLRRGRRANSGFLEEMKAGNLERECLEEICDYEEAREVFEDDDKTKQFWLSYSGKEPCLTNPCKNNGSCVYVSDSYACLCAEGFEGRYCERGLEELLKCEYVNGGCEQFCDAAGPRRLCSCADGYTLGPDGTSCIPHVEFPCGRAPLQNGSAGSIRRASGGHFCPRGHCPWQVLIEYDGSGVCGGALLEDRWVITAAHCVHLKDVQRLRVITGEQDLDVRDGSEEAYAVSRVLIHESFDPVSADGDLALVRLREDPRRSPYAVPVCLPTLQLAESELTGTRFHTLSGWGTRTSGGATQPTGGLRTRASGVLQRLAVPLMPAEQCASHSGLNITQNMLCAGYAVGTLQSCRGHDGSPLVTHYEGTAFLTGVVSWGNGCQQPGYYWIHSRVANYLKWIESGMKTAEAGAPIEQSHAN